MKKSTNYYLPETVSDFRNEIYAFGQMEEVVSQFVVDLKNGIECIFINKYDEGQVYPWGRQGRHEQSNSNREKTWNNTIAQAQGIYNGRVCYEDSINSRHCMNAQFVLPLLVVYKWHIPKFILW